MKGTLRPNLPDGLEDAYARLLGLTGLLAQLAEGGSDDSQLSGTFGSLFDLAESIRRDFAMIINEPEKPAGGAS